MPAPDATAIAEAVAAWQAEPAPGDEGLYTSDGQGWMAWNGQSPEVEFAEFAGALATLLRPGLVVETGVGQGYVTRRVRENCRAFTGYESDDALRVALRDALDPSGDWLSNAPGPSVRTIERADLVILDSAPATRRLAELGMWRQHGKPGSYLLMHDVRPDHPKPRGIHRRLAREVGPARGVVLGNPRGGWLARHP